MNKIDCFHGKFVKLGVSEKKLLLSRKIHKIECCGKKIEKNWLFTRKIREIGYGVALVGKKKELYSQKNFSNCVLQKNV